ncbi:MAG: nucleotidyltransferase domain-containing protein [Sporichthyaceae bacterium]
MSTTTQHHPHSSETAREIAERGTILRAQVGSGVHGTSISGQDDRDEMGLCLEPREYVTGVSRVPSSGSEDPATVPFEQYEYHTAWEREGGLANRSGAGDLDVIIYSARKWTRLALAGNPTVLLPLFVPAEEIVTITHAGHELRANAHRIASRRASERFVGYMVGQRRAMTGEVGAHTNRPELVAQFGYDCKFAMHALRLGVQGIEYLRTGRITLPIPEPDLAALREVRRGEWELPAVMEWLVRIEAELTETARRSPLPEHPDLDWVNAWLHRSYTAHWGS